MPLAALLAVLKQQPQAARQPAGRDESVDGQPSHVVISSWLLAAMWHTRVDGQPSHVVISSWLLAAMWHTRRVQLVAWRQATGGAPMSPATQTRPSSSVSALAVAAFGPAVGSSTYRVRPGNSRAACASKLVPLRDAFGCTACCAEAAATGSTAAGRPR